MRLFFVTIHDRSASRGTFTKRNDVSNCSPPRLMYLIPVRWRWGLALGRVGAGGASGPFSLCARPLEVLQPR